MTQTPRAGESPVVGSNLPPRPSQSAFISPSVIAFFAAVVTGTLICSGGVGAGVAAGTASAARAAAATPAHMAVLSAFNSMPPFRRVTPTATLTQKPRRLQLG